VGKLESSILVFAAFSILFLGVIIVDSILKEKIKSDIGLVVITFLQVLVSVLLIAVILKQSKIAEKQNKIIDRQTKFFEIDKMPIIDLDVAVDTVEGEPHEIKTGTKKFYYNIHNLSKYPIRILEVLADDKEVKPYQRTIRPERATQIEFDERPVKIRIEVANLLDRSITSKFVYDVSKDEIELEECS